MLTSEERMLWFAEAWPIIASPRFGRSQRDRPVQRRHRQTSPANARACVSETGPAMKRKPHPVKGIDRTSLEL